MNSYRYLINKIYPARVNEQSDLQFYKAMEKAYFKLQSAQEKNETLFLDYRNAFYLLRKHIYSAIADAYRLIRSQIDDFDRKLLESNIEKLNSPLYDINELEEILSYTNLILSGYDLNIILNDHHDHD